MAEAYVRHEFHQGVTTVEFFHPQSNSLPAAILNELAVVIRKAGEDPNTIVIVLRSAGDRTFCAGASFEELAAIENEKQGLEFFSGFAKVINAMRHCPKMIIARIHGKCVGGGVGLAAAVDYAIAVEGADIKLSELAIGIGPFVVGPAVERKIGTSAFSQLAIDSTMWRNADWAKRKGLYAELHTNIEDMDESVQRLSGNLALSSPEALQAIKQITWKGTADWDQLLMERAAISGRLVMSSFAKKCYSEIQDEMINPHKNA